jgi:hypothetical protein
VIDLVSQHENSATLMEIKPKISLGHNPLSDVPYQKPDVVSNGQGSGRHPQVTRRILVWIRWQVSKDQVVASLVTHYINIRV